MTAATTDFARLLPADPLIADRRSDTPPAAIADAPTLRIAAAEVVREGYLLHYAEPRFYRFDDDDLALLAGDRMYAAGLAALSAEGDTPAVAALASLIAGCAEAHAVGDFARADDLWESTLAMLAPDSDTDGSV